MTLNYWISCIPNHFAFQCQAIVRVIESYVSPVSSNQCQPFAHTTRHRGRQTTNYGSMEYLQDSLQWSNSTIERLQWELNTQQHSLYEARSQLTNSRILTDTLNLELKVLHARLEDSAQSVILCSVTKYFDLCAIIFLQTRTNYSVF